MNRWWQGAGIFLGCAMTYVIAFPVAGLDELGVIEATNWTYWLPAAALAPFIAGGKGFRRMFRDIAKDERDTGQLKRRG